MKNFNYVAVNKKGEKVVGVLEANSKDEIASILIDSGVTPLKISEKVQVGNILNISLTGNSIGIKDKVLFLREFSTMISAGLALDDSLEVSISQTENKLFKSVLDGITKDIRSGSSLADAFQKYPNIFKPIEVSLIRAGEVSGKLDTILLRLAEDVEKSAQLNAKVRGALSYPFFVILIAGAVVSLIVVKLVPAMSSLYASFGAKTLPLPTQILVWLSDFMISYWWLVTFLLIVLYFGYKYYTAREDGRIVKDSLILKLPVVGDLVGKYQVVTFIKTYSMLLASGIPVINSLNLVGESLSNRLYAKAVQGAAKDLEKGISLAAALSKYEVIPSILWRTIAIGEETGKTEEILNKVGKYFEEEVNDKVNNLTRLLEPVLLVVLGGAVAFIAVAIYLPIYNFSSVVH